MFTPFQLGLLKLMDAAVADAVRALRPGGPLDRTTYATHCKGCGQKVRKSLRWFQAHEVCSACGGQFDTTDLRRHIVALMRQDFAAVRAITTVQFLDDDS